MIGEEPRRDQEDTERNLETSRIDTGSDRAPFDGIEEQWETGDRRELERNGVCSS
ncbi:hypothetical protein [Natronorubrum sp. FCH18a]|uniref:hypothetical protein n=1 Tax=Natronorubrum sp. FCH18a TaxID=3447018 RepID=UPI003F5101B4